jgi:hypothetical protein
VPGYAASVLEHQRLLGILQQQYLNLAVLALSRQHERAFLEIYHITLPGPPESRRRPVSNDSSHKKWFCSANIKLGSEGSDEHESDEHEITLCEAPLVSDSVPASLVGPVGSALPSPQTGIGEIEIQPSLRPPTPSPSPRALPGLSSPEIPSLGDMITEGVQIVCQLRHQHELPREVYSRILLTLRSDRKVISATRSGSDWSDGAIWVRVLEAGESRNRMTTIFNMLEYMGVWDWFDRQVELVLPMLRTGKNMRAARPSAASYVLKQLEGLQTTTGKPSKSIGGVGPLTTILEGESTSEKSSPAECVKTVQRNLMRGHLRTGRILRNKLVKELGFGILLSRKIW